MLRFSDRLEPLPAITPAVSAAVPSPSLPRLASLIQKPRPEPGQVMPWPARVAKTPGRRLDPTLLFSISRPLLVKIAGIQTIPNLIDQNSRSCEAGTSARGDQQGGSKRMALGSGKCFAASLSVSLASSCGKTSTYLTLIDSHRKTP